MIPVRDLSKTVLSIEPGPGAEDFLIFTENKPFITRDEPIPKRSDRAGTPQVTPPKLKLSIHIDKIPRQKSKGRSWMLGRNKEICDYLFHTDIDSGISAEHLEICHNWDSLAVIIVNLSCHPLVIQVGDNVERISQGMRRALCHARTTIEVGGLIFTLEIPNRGKWQSKYDENLENYRKTVENHVPDLASLAIRRGGKNTPAVNGSLALSTHASLPKYHYRGPPIGAGASGNVYKAIDRYTGSVVALKEFRNRPTDKILSEIEILYNIKHVRYRFVFVVYC